ncbi:uncharacterized protein LOC112511709 [Cynara cardunculus var. scolymus]|uniref:DUF1677 domain-containing protein n=1 Tax=Cynara cardunculus var. scolymus TaxID=59895 RepID=A0A103XVY4_CYNCS|nr:uncharacterized protein LOC112511709 [Cynara cardunculus var. scolymus]KVH97893.1 Protein of unknown function DUF1677, plant [Cynara cardunculus var. scolymus]
MSAMVMSDAMVTPATESQTIVTAPTTEVEFAKCECCGLTEECTPAYIERIRERYYGKWICGLCGEAVKDEIVRSERLITTEEAMARHMNFCRKPSSSSDPPPNPAVHLIAAMRQILRRSLDSPTRSLMSMPNSPLQSSDGVRLRRSESCFTNLTLDESSSYTELQGIEK